MGPCDPVRPRRFALNAQTGVRVFILFTTLAAFIGLTFPEAWAAPAATTTTLTVTSAGSDMLRAAYGGDGNFAPANASLTEVVELPAATPSFNPTPSSALYQPLRGDYHRFNARSDDLLHNRRNCTHHELGKVHQTY